MNFRREYEYPGHPISLAYFITQVYGDDIEEAYAETERGYPKALEDSRIPGAGGRVHAALELLHYLLNGEVDQEEVFSRAEDIWHSESKIFSEGRDCRRAYWDAGRPGGRLSGPRTYVGQDADISACPTCAWAFVYTTPCFPGGTP